MLKAINSSRSIKKTSNNKKNLPNRLCLKTRLGIKCLTTLQTVDKMTPGHVNLDVVGFFHSQWDTCLFLLLCVLV